MTKTTDRNPIGYSISIGGGMAAWCAGCAKQDPDLAEKMLDDVYPLDGTEEWLAGRHCEGTCGRVWWCMRGGRGGHWAVPIVEIPAPHVVEFLAEESKRAAQGGVK